MLAALLVAAVPVRADETKAQPEQGGMLCTDGMVTDPDNDDLEAIAVSAQVDGGCMVPDGPIGI
jgi:hypothetical protein